MPAINFKRQYVERVLDGSKPFTLRKRRKDYRDPAPLISHLKLFTGMRTKACRQFATASCAMRGTISFNHRGILFYEDRNIACSDGGGVVSGRSRSALLEEVRSTILQARDFPNGPATAARLERIAAWDGFPSWADMWAFHEEYGLNADGVAVRELIGFAHVRPTPDFADAHAAQPFDPAPTGDPEPETLV